MNYKTHIIGGITAMSILKELGTSPNLELISITTIGVIAGSLFPDIDHPKSYISKRAVITSHTISALSKHRGIFHTPFFNALISLCLFCAAKILVLGEQSFKLALGTSIGLFSHVFLDILTKQGIPFLYPLSKKRFRLIGITTGGFFEKVFGVGMILFYFIFGMYRR